MKHLKAFEFYFYGQEEEMEEPKEETTPYGEEEAGEDQPSKFDRYKRGERGEMSRHELELRYPELAEEDEEEEEEEMMGEEEFGNKISSFKNYNEATCPSCNCKECECGGGSRANEAKKPKLDPVGKEDEDVNNNGKKNDSSDKYIMNRRKAIEKSMDKKGGKTSKSSKESAKDEKGTKADLKKK